MNRPPLGINARCQITNCVDGDTVDLELRIPLRVRLLNCWAPETRTKDLQEKHKGIAAKLNLQSLADNSHGQVFIPTGQAKSVLDVLTMERVLGRVWIDGQIDDLSTQQVLGGFASSVKGGRCGQ